VLLLINILGASLTFGLMLYWGWEFAFLGAIIGGTAATFLAAGWRAYMLRDVSGQNADQRKF
jgi:hypothetical protein